MYLWQEYHRSDAVFFPMQPIKETHELNYTITDDVHFDCFVKVVSAKLLNCSYFFPVVIIILWEGTLRLDTNPVLHKTLSLYQHGLMVSYFIQWFIIHYSYYWFCCLNCPRFGHRELHQAGFCDLDKSSSFFEYVLTFQHSMTFQAHLVLSLP